MWFKLVSLSKLYSKTILLWFFCHGIGGGSRYRGYECVRCSIGIPSNFFDRGGSTNTIASLIRRSSSYRHPSPHKDLINLFFYLYTKSLCKVQMLPVVLSAEDTGCALQRQSGGIKKNRLIIYYTNVILWRKTRFSDQIINLNVW